MADGLLSDADVGLAPVGAGPPAPSNLLSDADVGLGGGAAPAGGSSSSGPLANSGNEGWLSGGLKGAATAAIRAAGNIPGVFGNISDASDALSAGFDHLVTGRTMGQSRQALKDAKAAQQAHASAWGMNLPSAQDFMPSGSTFSNPVLAKTGAYEPTSEAGKIAQTGFETALSGVGPGMGAAAPGAALKTIGMGALKMAPANAASGAAGQAAGDVTGNPYAAVGASLLAPMGVDAAAGAASRMSKLGRDAGVGDMIRAKSSDPDELETKLGMKGVVDGASSPAIPGWTPTAGQVGGGDLGLLQAEYKARNGPNNEAWTQRDADANTALQQARQRAAPAGADPMAPTNYLNDTLAKTDASTQADLNAATQRAQSLAAPLAQPGMTPEEGGAAIRGPVVDTMDKLNQTRRDAYSQAETAGAGLGQDASGIKDAAKGITDTFKKGIHGPFNSDEQALYKDAKNLPADLPYNDLVDFDQRVTGLLKNARQSNDFSAANRLKTLKDATLDALNNQEPKLIPAEPSDISAADADVAPAQSWLDDNDTQRAGVVGGDAGVGEASQQDGGLSLSGAAGASRGAPRNDAGVQGISEPSAAAAEVRPPSSPVTEAAIDLINKAKQAHVDFSTRRNGVVAPILKDDGFKGQYKVPDAGVPAKAVVKGDLGYHVAKAYIRDTGADEGALAAMKDRALEPLRQAMSPDKTLSQKAVDKWRADYGPAIRALDEASPGFSKSVETAGKAQTAMLDAGAIRQMQLDDLQKGVAGKFIGKSTEEEARAELGSILSDKRNGAAKIQALVNKVKDNPNALAGAQKLAIDWLGDSFSNMSNVGTSSDRTLSGRLGPWLETHGATAAKLLSKEQMNRLYAIKTGLESEARVHANNVKQNSQSGRILSAAAEKAGKHGSLLSGILGGGSAELAMKLFEGDLSLPHILSLGGAALAAGAVKVGSHEKAIRQALFQDAIRSPERTRYYLERSTPQDGGKITRALSASIRRSLIAQSSAQPQ